MKKPTFWNINLGNVITMLVYLVTFSYFIGQLNSKVSYQGLKLEDTITKVSYLEQKVTKMDSEGPVASNKDSQVIVANIAGLDARVARLEQMLPKLEVISRDLEWIKSFLLNNKTLPEAPKEPIK